MPNDMNGSAPDPVLISDQSSSEPGGMLPEGGVDQRPGSARRFSRGRSIRKWILLALLLLLLGLLGYSAYYFNQNKSLPIPGLGRLEAALTPPEYLFSITGAGSNQLKNPVGVGVGRDGRVYAVDFDNKRISVFNQNGRYLFSFSKVADGKATALRAPVHLAIAKDGNIWVTDRRLRGIYIFTADGKFVRKFLPNGDPNFQWSPLALTFDADGALRVTNVAFSDQHEVIYFDSSGQIKKRVGQTAQVKNAEEAPGFFYFPNGLAVTSDGRVYVSDGDNRRVQVLDDAGLFKRFVATSGVPRGIAIDSQKRLYVVDALAHQVDIYDLEGKALTKFGEQGFGPGQFNYPNDVALFNNRIFITDRGNDQVQVWGWPTTAIPVVRAPSTPLGWLLCLSPLLLLPLLLLLRRKRFAVTEDFVDAMIAVGRVDMLEERRFRFVTPEPDHGVFVGRVEEGVDLGEVIQAEPYSDSDARAIAEWLGVSETTSIRLSVAKRTKGLCTEDEELRRFAIIMDIAVYDQAEFIARYARQARGSDDEYQGTV